MVWFKVDDGFYTSSKVLSIPRTCRLAAVGLWTLAGNWSARNLTDGTVPEYVLLEVGATPRLRQALTEARLWVDRGSAGVEFHDWAAYQPTRGQVEEERSAAAERQRKWRERKSGEMRESHVSNGVTDALVTRESHDPDPTRPDPTLEKTSSSLDRSADAAPSAPPKKREARLPADWRPTPEHKDRANELRLDVNWEAQKFRAHAEEKGRTAKSWNGAFTRWLMNAAEYAGRDPRSNQPQLRAVNDQSWMS